MSKELQMDELETRFPKMMALYKACTSSEPEIIFNRIPYELQHADWAYEEYEELLSRLTETDFEYLLTKILPRGKADALRGYHQFFDTINEVRGYTYLQDQGYKKVRLIKEKEEATPDVGAFKKGQLDCILEVKTINVSDDHLLMWENLVKAENRRMRAGKSGVPDRMKDKIKNSISVAKTQVASYASTLQIRRVIYLVIMMDTDYALDSRNWSELGEFIGELNSTEENIEILHEGIGWGKYARKDLEKAR